MKVFLQGRLVEAAKASVSLFDHGFLYGDGLYETVRAYDYQLFLWPDHARRLRQSARRLELACPWSDRYLERQALRLLKANRSPDGTVRITVSRGPGPLGLNPKVCPHPTLAMMLHPVRDLAPLRTSGVTIGIPSIRRLHPETLDPGFKSNNALNTVLARAEVEPLNAFEAVLLNVDGQLTEGTTSNVFLVKAGRLLTPALSCGLLDGVTRRTVIDLAKRAGFAVREGRYRLADLRRADEVFLTSTTLEIMPVTRVQHGRQRLWRGSPGPVTRRLQALFRGIIHARRSHTTKKDHLWPKAKS